MSGWRLASASVIGTSHQFSGLPCQDSHATAIIEQGDDEILVAVAADGAGSARYSDRGAWLATTTLIELVDLYFLQGRTVGSLDRDTVATWLTQITLALESEADENGHEAREYACTLLGAIVGQHDAVFFQVGDGAIVVSHGPEDGWAFVFWPQHGEYSNTTNFVLSPNILEIFEFDIAPRQISELALFTDGIEKLVLHDASRTVHEGFFNAVFPAIRLAAPDVTHLSERLAAYLGSPRICARTDDDKTLILASRKPSRSDAAPDEDASI